MASPTTTSTFGVSLVSVFFFLLAFFNTGNAQPGLYHNRQSAQLQTNIATYHGAKATIGVHALPTVAPGSSSAAFIEVVYGDSALNVIRAGWQVRPDLYGDTRTHFFTYWTGDVLAHTGGFDLRVGGFVASDGRPITPGDVLTHQVSGYGEEKYITLALYNEPDGWWLFYGEGAAEATQAVGYWPHHLFDGLAGSATSVGWGGAVEYPAGSQGPAMGSGQRASEGLDYMTASFKNMLLSRSNSKAAFTPVVRGMHSLYVTAPNCYDLVRVPDETNMGIKFYFGGPAGCTTH